MQRVIEYFGSKSETAKALGVEPAAVSWWLRFGLPPNRAIQIELLTDGALMARDIVGTTGGKE